VNAPATKHPNNGVVDVHAKCLGCKKWSFKRTVPIEEAPKALLERARAGKAHYMGCVAARTSELRLWGHFDESEQWKAHIGDVVVHPSNENPYRGFGLIGKERQAALRAFRDDGKVDGYYVWYAPSSGGAALIEPEDVDWETSGL